MDGIRDSGTENKWNKTKSFKSFSFNVDWYADGETLTETNRPCFQSESAVFLSCDFYKTVL